MIYGQYGEKAVVQSNLFRVNWILCDKTMGNLYLKEMKSASFQCIDSDHHQTVKHRSYAQSLFSLLTKQHKILLMLSHDYF